MSSSYYLGLMRENEEKQKELNKDIENYNSLKDSANSCIPQIESIIKTFKNVASCLQYVCPIGTPFDNGQCLTNAKKLEEVVVQLNLLINECTTELMILEQKLANAQRDYSRFKNLYNIELEKEKQVAIKSTETLESTSTGCSGVYSNNHSGSRSSTGCSSIYSSSISKPGSSSNSKSRYTSLN